MGRHAEKNTTSSYLQLDARLLQRKGYLRSMDGWLPLTWSRDGEPIGSVRIRVEEGRVILRYRHQRYGEDWKNHEYSVFLDRTHCHFGGTRVWFRCPAQYCSRRVAILYGGSIFACRHCHQLGYDSQREAAHSRALTRAQRIRERLGGSGSMVEEFPDRPKWMHHQTYWRLIREYEEAESQSWSPWLLRMIMES
jgi:hypothetical protein